jgi:leucyl-tRNA synthetase
MLSNEKGIRKELETAFHKTIKKVGDDIETLKFNTAIATLMALMNDIYEVGSITLDELKVFTILINSFAPHVTEEMWEVMKYGNGLACEQKWPEYDEAKCVEDTVEIVAQVNGKVRAHLSVAAGITKEAAISAAKADEKIVAELTGKTIVKEIYVPGKLVNIVAK